MKNPVVVVTPGHGAPKMLHRSDCSHIDYPGSPTKTRPATAQERRTLRDCQSCALREERER